MSITDEEKNQVDGKPEYWCNACQKDLQSQLSLEQHQQGRKHLKKMHQQGLLEPNTNTKRPIYSSSLPQIDDEEEIFLGLATGQFRNVVVLTGAGVSTSSGISDFRTPVTGLFARLRNKFGNQFPQHMATPEIFLSRAFYNRDPEFWLSQVWPLAKLDHQGAKPSTTHKFCAFLEQQGVLKRIYTQNIDGLHTHPSLLKQAPNLRDKVVECHGSLERGDIVMYGDSLPQCFEDACNQDFCPYVSPEDAVDLVIVFGTSLQVAPFCGVPNMAPRGCPRVLVNRHIGECLTNDFSRRSNGLSSSYTCSVSIPSSISIGKRKAVSLRSMWTGREGRKRWRQHVSEGDCDDFCNRFIAFCTRQGLEYSFEQFD